MTPSAHSFATRDSDAVDQTQTQRSRRIPRPRKPRRRLLPAAVLALMLLVTFAAPALADGAAAPGWAADSGNAGGYTTSLSCPTMTFCVAVDFNGAAVTFNGQGWDAGTTLKPDQTTSEGTFGVPLTGVSCASASFCVAVDNAGDAFTYDGIAWSGPTSVDPGTQLNSVSCPTSAYCRATDVSGNVFEYEAGSWASNPAGGELHVACSSPSSCWYLGGSPTGGYSEATGAITCLPTPFCVAANDGGGISTWDGGPKFGPVMQVTPPQGGFSGVSCASESLCVAIDGPDSAFYMYDGTNWTAAQYQNIYKLNAVSCVAGGVCVAVDSIGDVVSYPTALPGNQTSTGQPPTPTPGGTTPTATQVRKSLASLLRVTPSKRWIAALLSHKGKTLTWNVRYVGRLTLTLSVIVRGKPVTAATARAKYSKLGTFKVVLRPTQSGKRTLARKPPLKVVLDAVFTPTGASAIRVSKRAVIR